MTLKHRAPPTADGVPAELSPSSVEIFLLGWADAPTPPLGERGRWQLAFLSPEDCWALYQQHRSWLCAEARRRGLAEPWAEKHMDRTTPDALRRRG